MSGFRPILPAASELLSGGAEHSSHQRNLQLKRPSAKAACEPCRQGKRKCNGMRPICSACTQREADCYYTVGHGLTRTAAAKREIQTLKDIITGLCHACGANSAIAIASQLEPHNFRNLEEVASALRHLASATERATQPNPIEEIQTSSEISHTTTAQSHKLVKHSPRQYSVLSCCAGPRHSTTESPRIQPRQGPASRPTAGALAIDSAPRSKINGTAESPIKSLTRQSRYWFVPRDVVKSLDIYGMPLPQSTVPVHAVQVANSIDKRHISARYTNYVSAKRMLIENDCSAIDVLGPKRMEPAQLLNMGIVPPEESKPVCEWTTGTVNNFDLLCIAEKLASILLMAPLLRWQISPTLEHYNDIASCMKPTPTQMMIPHPAWIDYIPWPDIRDYFINVPSALEGRDALQLLTRYTSINWSETEESMLCLNPSTDALVLSDNFEAWATDINHWSLDCAILLEFPTLVERAWITDNGQSGNSDFAHDKQLFQDLVQEHLNPTLASATAMEISL